VLRAEALIFLIGAWELGNIRIIVIDLTSSGANFGAIEQGDLEREKMQKIIRWQLLEYNSQLNYRLKRNLVFWRWKYQSVV
jgi:hypothetical protein